MISIWLFSSNFYKVCLKAAAKTPIGLSCIWTFCRAVWLPGKRKIALNQRLKYRERIKIVTDYEHLWQLSFSFLKWTRSNFWVFVTDWEWFRIVAPLGLLVVSSAEAVRLERRKWERQVRLFQAPVMRRMTYLVQVLFKNAQNRTQRKFHWRSQSL